MDGQWDIIISLLQELYNANEKISFDDPVNEKRINFQNLSEDQLKSQLERFQEHNQNIKLARGLLVTILQNLEPVLQYVRENSQNGEGMNVKNNEADSRGRSYWSNPHNPNEPILVGSEVAYKPKRSGDGEWFQCEVVKISGDGTKFEVRDPEPDEFGNQGQMYKCNWKDIILIPPPHLPKQMTPNYPAGTKVLARYPETTTFYPAFVIGNKRDGTCRLRFDGEDEVDKETEVSRRLVLPFPSRR
ncbi:LAFE_0F09934g1_1 [Lachancea fermentati]|uniref:LAFE_0F09934g1_1 n=1 Tax=Lachancea fermentati TaxID=4955 RepID=A0A1G4MF91_LACFM|nr:LAFE_0F09934g1_1 [Lachancea fermentati]